MDFFYLLYILLVITIDRGIPMNTVLIVDDEFEIRQLIQLHLENADFFILEATSGSEAIQTLQTHQIDVVILDLTMDDGDGFDVLQFLNHNQNRPLIIALSARREVEDKITTLELGADDYVTKPFSPMELVARVQALLRRRLLISPLQSETIRLNKIVLNIQNNTLHYREKKHALTSVECELLQLFMQNANHVLTKREIYKHIWQHENYDDNNLSVFISRLRKILEQVTGQHSLDSVRGVGYRFSGDGL